MPLPITKEVVVSFVNSMSREDQLRLMNGECDTPEFLNSVAGATPSVAGGGGGNSSRGARGGAQRGRGARGGFTGRAGRGAN